MRQQLSNESEKCRAECQCVRYMYNICVRYMYNIRLLCHMCRYKRFALSIIAAIANLVFG